MRIPKLAIIGCLSSVVLWADPSDPAWWTEQGVIPAQTIPPGPGETGYDPEVYADWLEINHALANLGQLKNLVDSAHTAMEGIASGSSGSQLGPIVSGFSTDPEDNFVSANLGQAKSLAQAVYDAALLNVPSLTLSNGVVVTSGFYPWDPLTPVEENYAPINIGQLKHLFSFDLTDFETSVHSDTDGDGVSNVDETILLGTDPNQQTDALFFDIPITGFREFGDAIPHFFTSLPENSNDGSFITGNGFLHILREFPIATIFAEPAITGAEQGDVFLITFKVIRFNDVGTPDGLDVWLGDGPFVDGARSRVLMSRVPGGEDSHGWDHLNHILNEEGDYAFLLEIDEPVTGQSLNLYFFDQVDPINLEVRNVTLGKIYYGPELSVDVDLDGLTLYEELGVHGSDPNTADHPAVALTLFTPIR